MDLIGIFRTFHPNAEEYTFFSSAYGTYSRIDHILGHKSNLSKLKKIEIISSIFSNHNAMKPDVNYKKKTVRNKNENMTTQNLWEAAKTVLRGKFGCFGLVVKSCLTLATPWTVA